MTKSPCFNCGYANEAGEKVCGLCSEILVAPPDPSARGYAPAPRMLERSRPSPVAATAPRRIPLGWLHLAIGMALSLAFTLTPALRFMGWLFGSLFHETGHVIFGWFVGCPAWPVISLQGHAAAVHKPQDLAVSLFVMALLMWGAYLAWQTRRFRVLAWSALAVWPLFTFVDDIQQLGFLLSGHLGELTFAGIFLWRARTGEAIKRAAERPLYAMLGWWLLVRNVALTFGLTFLPSARAWYLDNGSFGLTNDYARVAYHHLHVNLEVVSVFMLLVSLGVFPIVLAMTWTPPDPRRPVA